MLKKLYLVFTVLVISAILFGCSGSGADNPALATGEFILAVKAGQYIEARQYLTSDANKDYSDSDLDDFKAFFEKKDGVTTPLPDDVVIEGNNATEPLIWTDGEKTIKKTVYLKKSFGGWKINSIS